MNDDCENLPGMIGRHPSMLEVYRLVRRVAPTDLLVLSVGETGTGKELVARTIHSLGPRSSGPFLAVNCAGIPEPLAEAPSFGSEKGAYTSAHARHRGYLERAAGGTLFLGEVEDLSIGLQAKLLRVLDGHGFERVGGEETLRPAVRWVLAVQRPPAQLMREGRWRADFAYRGARIPIPVPPLRQRGADIALLANHFLAQAVNGRPTIALTADALQLLERHPWPGSDIVIPAPDWRTALEADGWNVRATARTLGVSVATLKRRRGRAIAPARARRRVAH